ncbi:MAG: hypothetical protein L7U83_14690, partial [Akkermansiaceae bacterium]|nr:hypothetical protein [Akkermansiaceae bacterium]
MNFHPSRRDIIQTSAAAGALGFLSKIPLLGKEDVNVNPSQVQFRPEIEPLVRLLEETPREKLLEEVASQIKKGTTYREILSSLLLAGVRNIQPRPVGFKFHAVLVVNSAHLASLRSPDSDRWLPIFWALDYFKSSQARDIEEGDWTMSAVKEVEVPSASKARALFREGLNQWDEEKVDAATAGLARTAGAQETFDLFARFGARDFRDIGHKAIYVANSWRTLQTVGWKHSEPVLRSLGYALLQHNGSNPAESDHEADRPGRLNEKLIHEIRGDWQRGELKKDATSEMLNVLRGGTWEAASRKVVELLNKGSSPQSIWDGLFQHASEMLMRLPGIISLHASTTTNALHYAHQHTANDETRRFLLLQNAAFLTMFRDRGGIKDGIAVDQFKPADGTPS